MQMAQNMKIAMHLDTPMSQNKCRFGIHADQTLLNLTRFIENMSNICISK